ncbi:mannose-1-phosphate guanylyltransferase/mannose-6-phosphate isomerase [Pseudokordiimonas caeni]|uniref:mannose-1-phosphate guanylyltransferase/mannose-6-phosphate isomerase n=1 Tax=Pseudokordiimonas caeni TaxID=2997908 RepID=UPI002811A7F7|nr:mannose-1-phosphate guanylyltransferase/mannose-6-phosphate isomerase [Pseudokordiimonas caeni]
MTRLSDHVGKIQPVILSGGSGSRLWPLSRTHYPKQFLPLHGDKSLFLQTLERVSHSYGFRDPMVIANEHHRFIVNEQALRADVALGPFLLEPVGRNTAPAIALAALRIAESDPDALLLVLPSDHVIADVPAFHKAVAKAAAVAIEGRLVCFGMTPTRAETGYGYIAAGKPVAGHEGAFAIAAFKEKPDAATAEGYLKSGGYSWNSGMFMFPAGLILDEFRAHAPAILDGAAKALASVRHDLNFERLGEAEFGAIPADSIDYAIMEKTARAAVVPASFGWSDVGSFGALWDIADKDAGGNVLRGDVITEACRNSYFHTDGRMVAALGLDDLIVVSTEDTVLVAHKGQDQDVKKLVERCKAEGRSLVDLHTTVYRPWGSYRSIAVGPQFQVKEIIVKPGKKLSLQMHHHRAEHWVVVEGTATVTRDEDILTLHEDQSIYLPLGCRHRLENPGKIDLRLIEVQSGSYLGEDDIVRFEDDFGRLKD